MRKTGQQLAFIRDDDAGPMTPELRAVVELLIEERVPCLYAAVPGFLSRETADYLGDKRAKHPDLVEINQHGFLHEQVVGGRHSYGEFGGGRPYEDQRAAIEEGREVLDSLFGESYARDIFTPPSNKFDHNTMRALADLGFTILSGLVKTKLHRRAVYGIGYALSTMHVFGTPISYHERRRTARYPLFELSTAIDADEETNLFGEKKVKSAEELVGEFQRARRVLRAVGIMLHHANYQSASKLDALRGYVHALRRDGVEFRSLPSIARELRG